LKYQKQQHTQQKAAMGEKGSPTYLSQLKAMIIRNLLLKKREKRKTIAVSIGWLPSMKLHILEQR
jgi:hypothetical protein